MATPKTSVVAEESEQRMFGASSNHIRVSLRSRHWPLLELQAAADRAAHRDHRHTHKAPPESNFRSPHNPSCDVAPDRLPQATQVAAAREDSADSVNGRRDGRCPPT